MGKKNINNGHLLRHKSHATTGFGSGLTPSIRSNNSKNKSLPNKIKKAMSTTREYAKGLPAYIAVDKLFLRRYNGAIQRISQTKAPQKRGIISMTLVPDETVDTPIKFIDWDPQIKALNDYRIYQQYLSNGFSHRQKTPYETQIIEQIKTFTPEQLATEIEKLENIAYGLV